MLSWAKASANANICFLLLILPLFSFLLLSKAPFLLCILQCCLPVSSPGAVCGFQHILAVKVTIISECSAERVAGGGCRSCSRSQSEEFPAMGRALLGEGPHSPASLLFGFFFPVAFFFFLMIGQFCSSHLFFFIREGE